MFAFFFVIFIIALILFIVLFSKDEHKDRITGSKNKVYEWITLGVTTLSFILMIVGTSSTSEVSTHFMELFIKLLIFIFVISGIITIAYYVRSHNNNLNDKEKLILKWARITCGISLVLSIFASYTTDASTSKVASHKMVHHHKSKSHVTEAPLTYLNVDGKTTHADDSGNDDIPDAEKTFDNQDTIKYNVKVNPGTKVFLNDDSTSNNYNGARLNKLSPTQYQVIMRYDKNADDPNINGYSMSIDAKVNHHRTAETNLSVNDNNTEIQQNEQEAKQKKQEAKAREKAKWASYTPLDFDSLSNMSEGQTQDLKKFVVKGRVASFGMDDSGQTQVIIDVPDSDRYFMITVSSKRDFMDRDYITVYGSNISTEGEVTDSMVNENGIDAGLSSEKLYTIESPEKVVDSSNS